MASGFFMLLDDIAAIMDDVATMSKVATQKTAGLLADDLAVNDEKASGFASSRELPVLWKITKGSIINKINHTSGYFSTECFLTASYCSHSYSWRNLFVIRRRFKNIRVLI